MSRQSLAFVHSADNVQFRQAVRRLFANLLLGNDADHLSAGLQDRVGQRTHCAYMRAAVDNSDLSAANTCPRVRTESMYAGWRPVLEPQKMHRDLNGFNLLASPTAAKSRVPCNRAGRLCVRLRAATRVSPSVLVLSLGLPRRGRGMAGR